jgi:hypothetical protein
MSNMSYCRFENTVADLEDCFDHMDENMDDKSDLEQRAGKKLIDLCCDIALDYSSEVQREIEEFWEIEEV